MKKLNLPNRLTLSRIILFIPLLVLFILFGYFKDINENMNLIARTIILSLILLVFIAAMITDFLDGYYARKRKLVTDFGKLFDPIADKIIVTSTLIFLSVNNFMPIWVVVIFIVRDIFVDAFRILMAKNNISVAASIWGKLKTIFQTIAIIFIILFAIIGIYYKILWASWWNILLNNIPTYFALAFSIISGVLYFKKVKPFIKSK
ncbi:CDP-diacylglycerol--glycerol-3-phosphate 3-phosphatidyltransferase [Mycoplasmopsis maculosa]|uniref:CDP-diacylglycerol--glycerol-3-phosphate 3-phosphatidyltransferase n=1 Tax=Mycoplasmopsis maculosa TaxID=114885 RepID=A0A449B4U0_9BACT|nr:CDP-diacylglycerol--glycerol-3-phosphate 3-phosphatidyltransferase [Mycoplasmopsis maculosa]VEU75586.1 CDP-diacylglycerol--glycerol-3-phosphate 3-phosphatidyltransferase [Mycoplasmopsis maculosa]